MKIIIHFKDNSRLELENVRMSTVYLTSARPELIFYFSGSDVNAQSTQEIYSLDSIASVCVIQ